MVRHARDVVAARAARGSAHVAPVISTMHLALRSFSRVLNGRTRTATRTFCVFGIARRASAPAAPAPARPPAEAEPLLVGAGYDKICKYPSSHEPGAADRNTFYRNPEHDRIQL